MDDPVRKIGPVGEAYDEGADPMPMVLKGENSGSSGPGAARTVDKADRETRERARRHTQEESWPSRRMDRSCTLPLTLPEPDLAINDMSNHFG